MSSDSVDENLEISETTVSKCVERFCKAIVAQFGPEFLRPPTTEEIQLLLKENAKRGFVGMIGSIMF
jgi:hypothetical protein